MGVPPRGLVGVGWPTQRFGRGWETHLEVREGSGGPLKGPGVVGRPYERSGRELKALP